MKITRHVSMSINRALEFSDEELSGLFNGDGAKIRIELEERKTNGELKIGSEGCEGFSPITGCPGHESKQSNLSPSNDL